MGSTKVPGASSDLEVQALLPPFSPMSRASQASPPLQPYHLVGVVHACPGQPALSQGPCRLCCSLSGQLFRQILSLATSIFGVWLLTTLLAEVPAISPPHHHSLSFLSSGPQRCAEGFQFDITSFICHYSPWGEWAWLGR